MVEAFLKAFSHARSLQLLAVAGFLFSACIAGAQPGGRISLELCLTGNLLEVVQPWNATYEKLRSVSSKMWSTYPLSIVLPTSEEEIVATMACARRFGARVTARGGGHSNGGGSVMNGAISINLSNMNAVKVSDDLDTVTVQTGATAGEVVYEVVSKSNHTRNVPVGQKPTVGMAGLTLGGGWGFASRQDGLLCDQLISVRMVLPGGEIVEATATNENSEIFWASCGGGGGNVGIATEFTMKTIKTPKRVTRVYLLANQTVENISFYQKLSMGLSDKITLNLEVTNNLPLDGGTSTDIGVPSSLRDVWLKLFPPLNEPGKLYIELVGIYFGDKEEFLAEIEALDVDNKSPIPLKSFQDGVKEMTMADAQLELMGWQNNGELKDLLYAYPEEHTYYNYVSLFLYDWLDERGIRVLMNAATWNTDASSLVYEFQALGGGKNKSAVARVGIEDTAFSHRNAKFGLLMKSNAREPLVAGSLYGRMQEQYTKLLLSQGIKDRPPPVYVNMIDLRLLEPLESYYGIYDKNGAVNGGGVTTDRLTARLTAIAGTTNPNGTLLTYQPLYPVASEREREEEEEEEG